MSEFQLPETDALTGLFNTRYAMDELRRVIIKESSVEYRAVGVVFADIFRFSQLNCSLGHHVGDKVLIAVANIVKSVTRAGEIACRYGDDEFLIILPDADLNEVARRAEELRAAVEKTPIVSERHEIYIPLSIGVAHSLSLSANSKLRSAEAIMRDADAKLMIDRERNLERFAAK